MDPSNGYAAPPGGNAQYVETKSVPASKDTTAHQRTYQACIPCRRRKVRCDLGSVDSPHEPPCQRCRRESKDCFFSATRRKKKKRDSTEGPRSVDEDEFEIRGGRKRLKATSVVDEEVPYEESYDELPRTPGGSVGRMQPLRRPEPPKPREYTEEDVKAGDKTAAVLQAAEVHGGHDALKVLYEAAQLRARENSNRTQQERPNFAGVSPASLPSATSPVMERTGTGSYTSAPMSMKPNDGAWKANSGTETARNSITEGSKSNFDASAYNSAIKAWLRYRFVRSGWFTAKEAADYVVYFYNHLAPLTPVALPDFKAYETHEQLLTQEPMLAVTILLIASRHMKLDGPGKVGRPYYIHDKLWKYLNGMITRVLWGQEQFGGGFCGAGAEPASDVNPLSRKGLRTLGTVESLVLLTEWHPRAMHFPPDETDDELMVPDQPVTTPGMPDGNEVPAGIGGQPMDTWLEPCWRSDRMCWMLLGTAMSLAYEIGVFDESGWERHTRPLNSEPPSGVELDTWNKRRGAVRDLLLVYLTQTSGRLGLTSMLPSTFSEPEASPLYNKPLGLHQSMQETILYFWLRMAHLMREGNQQIFRNKAFTRDLIKTGKYKATLDKLQGPLEAWRREFDQCISIPKFARYILEIEYEYCRVYVNALSLQAVAERCANLKDQPIAEVLDPPLEMARSSAITTNGVTPDVAIDGHILSKMLHADRKYMLAVAEASRNLLRVVVDGLYPDEYLRHAPVRTYFRIISVAIMLLKTFALGATESDVADALALMDRTIDALRTCVVDDVHVASRFAELLDKLTESLKPRLVRISADGRHARSRRASNHGAAVVSSALPNFTDQGSHGPQPHPNRATPGTSQNQPQYNNYNSFVQPSNTNGTPTNPLIGVPNNTYDFINEHGYSVMPPPSFNFESPDSATLSAGNAGSTGYDGYSGLGTIRDGDPNTGDWLALPLDPILHANVEVESSMYGPQIGNTDMLELLLATGSVHHQNGQNGY